MHRLATTLKYRFHIRTRHGLAVENLVIHGRDEADAHKKLRQMYPRCEVTECMIVAARKKPGNMNFEDVVSLLSK